MLRRQALLQASTLTLRARAVAPAQAPPEEREKDHPRGKIEREEKAAAAELAGRLISAQRELSLTFSDRDRSAALELAQSAVELGLDPLELEAVAREKMNELTRERRNYTGLFAAKERIGAEMRRRQIYRERTQPWKRSGPLLPAETEEERYEREQMEAELAKKERARQEQRAREDAAAAEEEARQRQADEQRAEERARRLAEISAGRVVGVEAAAESDAIDRLAREQDSLDDLQKIFEWREANRGPDDPLGWSVVDQNFDAWFLRAVMNPVVRDAVKRASVGARRWPGNGGGP